MFIFTLNPEIPFSVTRFDKKGEVIASIPVGYYDDSPFVVSAMVIFAPQPGYGDGSQLELVMAIVAGEPGVPHIDSYYDGLATKTILPDPSERAVVLAAIYSTIAGLIDELRPPAVVMTTHTANLPPTALQKFHQIASLFTQKGYVSGSADPWHGRWTWMMKLPPRGTPPPHLR